MKRVFKELLYGIGFELKRVNLLNSEKAQMQRLFESHKIDIVLDVGANNGQYGLFLRECGYKNKIISFEPQSSAYKELEKVSKNDLNWIVAPRMAIGDKEGITTINIAGNSYSSSILPMLNTHESFAPHSQYIGSEQADLLRLDKAAKEYIKDTDSSLFIKIDVQGFEKQVLSGSQDILPQVKGIQLELSLVSLYEGETLWLEMISLIKEMGFDLWAVRPGFSDSKSGRTLQLDGIFFRH